MACGPSPNKLTGLFHFSQQPAAELTKDSKLIASTWELDTSNGYLQGLGPDGKKPFLIIPKIWKVTRHRFDREILCLEYGTELDRSHVFLLCTHRRDADKWEDALCKITGQEPPPRRRMNTGVDKQYKNKRSKDVISAPLNNGFSLQAVDFSDQPDGQEDEHDDCDDDENTSGQCVPPGTNGHHKPRVPDEQHIADVLGSGVAPTPEQRHSGEEKLHATVCSFCRNEMDSLGQRISQSSITGSDSSENESVSMPKPLVSDPQPYRLTGLDCSSPPLHDDSCSSRSYTSPQPLLSHPSVIRSENVRRLREERDEESVTIHGKKSELANLGLKLCKHDDYFYVTGWERRHRDIGFLDCILAINAQKVCNVRAVQNLILTSEGETVTLRIRRSPCGLLVALHVRSRKELGIQLEGSEIVHMSADGALRQVCDPLCAWFSGERCRRSITSIGDRLVPRGASTEEVESRLDNAISHLTSSEPLVLYLHPTSFLEYLQVSANISCEDTLLNPVSRRPSKIKP